MDAIYYRTESVELPTEESSGSSPASLVGLPGLDKLDQKSSTNASTWDQPAILDMTSSNYWLQSDLGERFEVIPILCKVKRTSSRETRSENVPLIKTRIRGSHLMSTSSSAPPRTPITPKVARKSDKYRQLEKTIRDQEKIITLLESELGRKDASENLKRTLSLNCKWNQTSIADSTTNASERSCVLAMENSRRVNHGNFPQSQTISSTLANSSVPALAQRVRNLVRNIREETEISLARIDNLR